MAMPRVAHGAEHNAQDGSQCCEHSVHNFGGHTGPEMISGTWQETSLLITGLLL